MFQRIKDLYSGYNTLSKVMKAYVEFHCKRNPEFEESIRKYYAVAQADKAQRLAKIAQQ